MRRGPGAAGAAGVEVSDTGDGLSKGFAPRVDGGWTFLSSKLEFAARRDVRLRADCRGCAFAFRSQPSDETG